LVAGGFGKLKGKVFRIGCMGEVNKYHVMRTISSINSVTSILNAKTNDEPLSIAAEKLKAIP
jgi:aspartate aminotransferase-like enzyme